MKNEEIEGFKREKKRGFIKCWNHETGDGGENYGRWINVRE